MLTSLDLFSGACGGWSLGFHRAGIKTVAACEIDDWRRQEYGRKFPGVKLYDDVKTLTADRLSADGIGPIDILAGSPPCQDASTANTSGKGVDGARTGLFFEALRLVRELRPIWVTLENVPGLRTRGYDRVHDELEAAGYAVRPIVVGAWHAGAPHRRNRVWIIAHREGDGWGPGRPRRSDRRAEGQTEHPFHDANPATVSRNTVAGNQPNRNPEFACADSAAESAQEQVGSAGQSWREVDGSFADAEKIAGGGGPDESQSEPQERSDGNADKARLEIIGGEPGDDGKELTPLERAIATRCRPIAEAWNGGIAGRSRVDDGLPKGMARKLLAAYGDAVVPIIPELIGRFIVGET